MSRIRNSKRKRAIRSTLQSAMDNTDYVKISRRHSSSEFIDGFVVGLGTEWVALAVQTLGRVPDGFEILRIRYITSVVVDESSTTTERRIMEARQAWPPPSLDIDLDDTPTLLQQLGYQYPLMSFHTEKRFPGMFFVGKLFKIDDGWVGYFELDAEAQWDDDMWWLKLRKLTRLVVGNEYHASLQLIADPPPEWEPDQKSN